MSDYFNNDNRICKVLQILEHKRSASLEYLEKKLNVSTKSIKNDIKELNETLKDLVWNFECSILGNSLKVYIVKS